MPTGTKIITIVIVILLGVAGMYYMTATPSTPNATRTTPSTTPTTTTPSTTTTVPTLTLTPNAPGATTTTPTATTTVPAPTGTLPGGTPTTGISRPQPVITPGAATPSGTGKADTTTGPITATPTTTTPGAGTVGALPPRFTNGIARGPANGTSTPNVGTEPTGTHAGGPTPTGVNNPNGLAGGSTVANNSNGGAPASLRPDVPTPTTTSPTTTSPNATPPNALGERTHIVASGDSFGALAKKYYGSAAKWQLISKANPLVVPERLSIGQKLRIPADAAAGTLAAETNAVNPINNAGSGSTARGNTATNGNSTHVVAKGETLSSISRKYYGSDKYWKQILSANTGTTEKNLKIGQKLSIPAKSVVATGENVTGAGS